MSLNHSFLRELVLYEPSTGLFFLKRNWKTRSAGAQISKKSKSGYCIVYLGTKHARPTYSAHRLAWFYMTGKWPDHQIDHANMDPSDNRWENLREATPAQNNYNRSAWSNTGIRGVSKIGNKFVTYVKIGGKPTRFSFDCIEDAHAKYVEHTYPIAGKFLRTPEIQLRVTSTGVAASSITLS